MQFTKVMGLAAVGACWRSQRRPSAPTRCRSAIPAPPQRFRRTPNWRRRKCIGGITTITVGIASTIIIATTIIVTGVAGKCGSLAQRSAGPLHRGPVSIQGVPLKRARLLPVISYQGVQ